METLKTLIKRYLGIDVLEFRARKDHERLSNLETKSPYDGKYFYEVFRDDEPENGGFNLKLAGPLDNIRFAVNKDDGFPSAEYPYAQVIDGKVKAVFKQGEIFVSDKLI